MNTDNHAIEMPPKELRKIGFLLIEEFALMSASAAIEPLRAANLLAQTPLFEFRYFSNGGGAVSSSCGATFSTTDLNAAAGDRVDILFVIAGGDPMHFENASVFGSLRSLASRGVPLGGISGGAVLLAKAGLMANRRFTVHWEHYEALRALSDDYLMERRLYVIDRDRYTCAGGVAPLDMMHAVIRAFHGSDLAAKVSDWFIHTSIRDAEDPQRSGYASSNNGLHPSVLTAIGLMESHIADPLTLGQLAMLSSIGPRQLQRRFEEELGKGVIQCYLEIRLQKADELVRKTRLPMMEVAIAAGFVNQAHFAKAFRKAYGVTPSLRRRQQSQ